MIVFRLTKESYKDDLSGIGAELYGGRWNSRGIRMLYTSTSRALAIAEVAVHLDYRWIPKNYWMVSLKVPDHLPVLTLTGIEEIKDWNAHPPCDTTQKLGDIFVKNSEFVGMQVPSVVVEGDYNLLLNPMYSAYHEIKVLESKPFWFDDRFFKIPESLAIVWLFAITRAL